MTGGLGGFRSQVKIQPQLSVYSATVQVKLRLQTADVQLLISYLSRYIIQPYKTCGERLLIELVMSVYFLLEATKVTILVFSDFGKSKQLIIRITCRPLNTIAFLNEIIKSSDLCIILFTCTQAQMNRA